MSYTTNTTTTGYTLTVGSMSMIGPGCQVGSIIIPDNCRCRWWDNGTREQLDGCPVHPNQKRNAMKEHMIYEVKFRRQSTGTVLVAASNQADAEAEAAGLIQDLDWVAEADALDAVHLVKRGNKFPRGTRVWTAARGWVRPSVARRGH